MPYHSAHIKDGLKKLSFLHFSIWRYVDFPEKNSKNVMGSFLWALCIQPAAADLLMVTMYIAGSG